MSARYAKPGILASFPDEGPVTIEASAGTGKTYTLEHLIVELLLTHDDLAIENILVVTFTEKATDELRARVRGLMERLVRGDFEAPDDDASVWVIDDRARALLRDQVRRFDRAAIHTIHGFCQRLLTEHAFANRRLFGQTVVDGRRVFRRTFNELLRRRWSTEAPYRRLLGAWLATGKQLSTLESALFRCIEVRVPIQNALTLEDWNQRVDVLEEWISSEIPSILVREAEESTTVHAATAKKIKRCFESWPDVVGDETVLDTVSKQIGTGKTRQKFFSTVSSLSETGKQSVRVLEAALKARSALTATTYHALLQNARDAFYHDKSSRGQLDFDDMLRIVAETVERDPDGVAPTAVREQYRFALIDEFQDTDDLQWRIFSTLFPPTSTSNRMITVGDPKQAIYGFRGADVYTYLNATKAIKAAGTKLHLDTNFRSSAVVIRGVNEILDQRANEAFFPRANPIRYDVPVKPAPGRTEDGTPGITLWRFEADIDRAKASRAHARHIAREAKRLVAEDVVADAADIFVLVRTGAEGEVVADAMEEIRLPYGFVRQESAFEASEAGAVLDLLDAIANPFDRSRRYKAWLTPFFGVALRDLSRLADADADHPLFRRLLAWHELARKRRYDLLFPSLLDASGLRRRALFADATSRALSNVTHVLDLLEDEAGRRTMTIEEVCDELQSWIAKRAVPTSGDGLLQRVDQRGGAVQILTMHMSKGLEAQVVFVFGGMTSGRGGDDSVHTYHVPEDGSLVARAHAGPLNAAGDVKALVNGEKDDEDRRLLYVAMTRARDHLYLPLFRGRTLLRTAFYARLNQRLESMAGAGLSDAFRTEDVDTNQRPVTLPEAEDLTAWTPPPAITAKTLDVDALRGSAAPLVVSSYTRMKRAGRSRRSEGLTWGDDLESRGFDDGEAESGTSSDALGSALPGGAAIGVFLHALLESIPFDWAWDVDFEQWRGNPDVIAAIDQAIRVHDLDTALFEPTAQILYRAITTPLHIGGTSLPPLFTVEAYDCELAFLFPIPEGAPRPRKTLAKPSEQIGRGYLRGYLDLAFECDDRVFVADWKTDVLPDYEPDTIERHVETNYALQWAIYTSAAVRWLAIGSEEEYEARFGGFAYLFLRGLADDPAQPGVWFHRSTWDEVMAFEAGLRDVRREFA